MKPRAKQDATRPARARRLGLASVLCLLVLVPPAGAQDTAPTAEPPQPDPAAQPDPAGSAPDPAPAATRQAPPATSFEPPAAAPEPQETASPAVAPVRAQEPERGSRRPAAHRADARRERSEPVVASARVAGDLPWERVPALVGSRSASGGDDDRVRQAAAGLLALCLASAALQLLTVRLRRGALP